MTGVQTCALPILFRGAGWSAKRNRSGSLDGKGHGSGAPLSRHSARAAARWPPQCSCGCVRIVPLGKLRALDKPHHPSTEGRAHSQRWDQPNPSAVRQSIDLHSTATRTAKLIAATYSDAASAWFPSNRTSRVGLQPRNAARAKSAGRTRATRCGRSSFVGGDAFLATC